MNQKLRIMILVIFYSSLSNCISTTYIKANASQAESETVRLPAGSLRPFWIVEIDDQTFPDGFADFIVMSPGKHTIKIRSLESEFLVTKLTRTFHAGTIVVICPGLNKSSHHNEALSEGDRWSPFIRELKHTDIVGLTKISTTFKYDCRYAYQRSFADELK
ncbi:hypothetical protein [Leptospira ryugenii]|nr:hypothetical protein [Leptospira ryugenii]